ncbi:MAG: hypothetical protein JNJ90_06530 [Saprospiraceae bacterium]|jgi:hypothetical protein|nr:hypothetical protein [Saprospiraceae bacterium]
MLDKIMLINGLIFICLLFSKKLSGKEDKNSNNVLYIGMAIFSLFFVVLSVLQLTNNHQMVTLITWGAVLVTSFALAYRLFQLLVKKQ